MLSDVDELPSIELGEFTLRFELEDLNDVSLEVAERELRETPERKACAIEELRTLLKGEWSGRGGNTKVYWMTDCLSLWVITRTNVNQFTRTWLTLSPAATGGHGLVDDQSSSMCNCGVNRYSGVEWSYSTCRHLFGVTKRVMIFWSDVLLHRDCSQHFLISAFCPL